jgi:hypothetical protein
VIKIQVLAAAAFAAAMVLAVCAPAAGASRALAATSAGGVGQVAIHCHARDGLKLPDQHCTPGVTYSKVTQADIGRTICKSGWTSTVRPPEDYTSDLKVVQIGQYGYARHDPHLYEEDHLIPLELGGSPTSVKNLWPEFDNGHIPNPKDAVENALKDAVCDGTVSLRAAQRAIAANWTTAKARLGL